MGELGGPGSAISAGRDSRPCAGREEERPSTRGYRPKCCRRSSGTKVSPHRRRGLGASVTCRPVRKPAALLPAERSAGVLADDVDALDFADRTVVVGDDTARRDPSSELPLAASHCCASGRAHAVPCSKSTLPSAAPTAGGGSTLLSLYARATPATMSPAFRRDHELRRGFRLEPAGTIGCAAPARDAQRARHAGLLLTTADLVSTDAADVQSG